jgi:hypothetical protein
MDSGGVNMAPLHIAMQLPVGRRQDHFLAELRIGLASEIIFN